eukprot:scaffold49510_cov37-Cyclotella_meneghiniana.AAC.3
MEELKEDGELAECGEATEVERVEADSGENIDHGNENAKEETTILMILGDCKHNPLSWRLERLHTQKSIVVLRRSTFISKQSGGGRGEPSALLAETIGD